MRTSLLTFALLLVPLAARAQNGTTFGCKGATYVPTVDSATLVVMKNGVALPVAPIALPNFLNQAECYCDSQDLELRFHLTKGLANGTQPGYTVFAGTNCDTSTGRSNNCEQMSGMDLDSTVNEFWQSNSGSYPQQKVPVRAVISPKVLNSTSYHACNTNSSQNMWFLFGNADPSDSCYVNLPAQVTLPSPPTGVTAGSGDGAVNISWTPPPMGSTIPAHYQVLCSDENGQPIPGSGGLAFGDTGSGHILGYSTCVGGTEIQRRGDIATSGTQPSNADMAGTNPDLMTANFPLGGESHHLGTEAAGDDMTVTPPDMGTGPDMAPLVPTNGTPGSTHFPNLDKRFVCSDNLEPTTNSVRIGGLENGHTYYFLVLGIDTFGNPIPGTPAVPQTGLGNEVSAGPQPVEDVYRRFIDDGGKPQGFCFIATAAWGSYQHPYVMILRDFRDQILLPTETGSAFVSWYYRTSPPFAAFIARHDAGRFAVRMALWPVILAAGLCMWLSWWEAAVLLFAVALLVRRKGVRRAIEDRSVRRLWSAA